ncbi:MAG: glycosyltransferase [Rhodobacteraceae bacterium]|nr:glycosyltransferase [Paracoccaceae bacterium]
MEFEVLYLADLRFPGGTSTSLKYDLRACKQAGLRAGIIPLCSPFFSRNRTLNASVLAEIRATGTVIVPQNERPRSRVALLYHPTLLDKRVQCRTRFDADVCYLVVHQTIRNRDGQRAFPADHWSTLISDWYGHSLKLLPVSEIVREDLVMNGLSHAVHQGSWANLIDLADYPEKQSREPKSPLVIGRHSRPSADKWPSLSVATTCYPQSTDFAFRMMGVPQSFVDQFEDLPSNWQVLPFSKGPISGFLQGLDIYSYFHSKALIEAFGYCVLEALATGLPCVVPRYMETSFSDACLYAEPDEAPLVYEQLRTDPQLYETTSRKARTFVEERFGLDQFTAKFEKIAEPSVAALPAPKTHRPAPAPVVLTITSNGVGLGHLSRQLAIARAIGPRANVVFFSLSEAIEIARSMGYLAEFRPFRQRLELDFKAWNSYFFQEMREALSHYKPCLTLFDGNLPYAGFVDAVESYGRATTVWIRRGLWRTPQPNSISREGFFDAIIEPGELCAPLDEGYSRPNPNSVTRVDPVLMTPRDQLFDRTTARRALNLPDDAILCLVQLGSEANFDMSLPRARLLEFLDRHPQVIAVDVRSPLHFEEHADFHERLVMRKVYPLGQYLKAFDFAACAAGYNTFHENIAAALPSIFIPNSNPIMDVQEARAEYGARAGWNLTSPAEDPYAIGEQLVQMLDPDFRQSLARSCLRKSGWWNGAQQTAHLLQAVAQLPANPLEER